MSEANRVNIVIGEETVLNETPATPLNYEQRFVSESLEHIKETEENDELRDDRHIEDVIEVGVSGQGDIQTNMSFGHADKLISAGLGSTFGANSGYTIDKATIQVVNATGKLIRSDVGGSWVTDGLTVNQWVRTRGFSNAANNGLFKVSAVTATDLTLTSGTGTLVDEAAATGRVVQGLFGTTSVAGVNIDAANADNSFNRASGSFVTDGFQVGQRVRTIGFTNAINNGIFLITSVAALKIIVSGASLTTEAAAAGRAIFGDHVRDGTTARSFIIERQYKDITKFVSYRGFRVSKLALSITTKQIIRLAITLMGVKGVSSGATVMGATTPVNKNRVVAAGTNVASVKEGGSVPGVAVSEWSMEVDAGLSTVDTIQSKEHDQIPLGTTKITGKAKLYLANLTHYDKFQNHTESSWEIQITDGDLNVYYITIPSLKYTVTQVGTPGINQPLWADMTWQAIHNNTYSCEIMIDRLPV